ncbi:hypothetical protein [Rhizobium leguminosarum]|uniref:hypothetical protein n=1 Tax=Rhizobium leguminosarum TaxID=384 RepID=UPI0004B4E8DB
MLTFLSGLRHDRIVAPFLLDGAINGTAFTAWIEQCLAPTLNLRHLRQSRQPQEIAGAQRHPQCRRLPVLLAALQPRLQSD